MQHQIKFDGQDLSFPCAADDSVLRASLRAGIGFPYECNSGGCGSCAFELLNGEVQSVWPDAPGLSERMRNKGMRLACQTQPRSDCTVRLRSRNRSGPALSPARRMGKLVSRTELTRDMIEFTFSTDDAADFIPGQFALLSLPGVTGDRAYSMSNLPNAGGHWSFVVKRMVNGRGTAALFDQVKANDHIPIDGPYGMAHIRSDCGLDIVCIAGGSGISPVLSILGSAARAAHFPDRRLSLFYGGRTPADLCAQPLIDRDPAMHGRVTCVSAISETCVGDAEWSGERGFIHDVVRRHLHDKVTAQQKRYYFCGPPMMTDAVSRMLMLDYRVPPSQVHFDRFV